MWSDCVDDTELSPVWLPNTQLHCVYLRVWTQKLSVCYNDDAIDDIGNENGESNWEELLWQ